ncbi:unnamed protein product [Alopecurus aequalis]
MAEEWTLPDLKAMSNLGTEWLLHLLDQKTETECTMILMTFWRIWYCRNEVTHHKAFPPTEASKRFLCSYLESILTIKQVPTADPAIGKTAVCVDSSRHRPEKKKVLKGDDHPVPWALPAEGNVKLNVDGSFDASSSSGGTGIILRDESGSIVISSCLHLRHCMDPLEAELEACREGIGVIQEWSSLLHSGDGLPCCSQDDS